MSLQDAQLEAAIALTQQAAESVNPIVKHMNNLEGSAAAFESGPEAAKAFVRKVIGRMRAANDEATHTVIGTADLFQRSRQRSASCSQSGSASPGCHANNGLRTGSSGCAFTR